MGRGVLAESLQGLDCFAVLTEADAKDYRNYWPEAPAEILVMRNATSFDVAADVPPLSSKVVLAAGRLHPVKGFPRLIEAWPPIAAEHPDWQLHICGVGPDKAELLEQVEETGSASRCACSAMSTTSGSECARQPCSP